MLSLSSSHGSRNVLRRIVSIKFLVNRLRDWTNLRAELLLNFVQIKSIIPVDQVNSHTQVPVSSRTTDAMKISLCILWKIEIDDHVDRLNVYTSSQKV